MLLPTVTELLPPRQRIEHDAFAEALPLRDPEPPLPGRVITMPQRTTPLRVVA
jgi:hypothetical protein